MRKHWKCKTCGVSMIAFYHEVDKHRATCGLPKAEEDPNALPSSFGKDGRKGPSLQVRPDKLASSSARIHLAVCSCCALGLDERE